jgi:Zn-dependent M28 family amino/carboxypeptidase
MRDVSPLRTVASLALLFSLACGGAAPPAAEPDVDPAVAEARAVVAELTGIHPPRSADEPGSMDRAAEAIAARFRAIGLAPRIDAFDVAGTTYENVVALIGSGDRPRIVVGAHYDVFDARPGADDNASGVAALLGVARLLAGRELGADVELVAFALEEPPFFRTDAMGSSVHARALKRAGVPVRAMLSLEMLGYYCEAPGCQRYPDPSLADRFGDTGDFVAVVGREADASVLGRLGPAMAAATDLRAVWLPAPADLDALDWSDHLSFWNEGFPAVLVTDTAFLRNPHYHQASDLPETLDYDRLAKAAQAVAAGIAALAGPL